MIVYGMDVYISNFCKIGSMFPYNYATFEKDITVLFEFMCGWESVPNNCLKGVNIGVTNNHCIICACFVEINYEQQKFIVCKDCMLTCIGHKITFFKTFTIGRFISYRGLFRYDHPYTFYPNSCLSGDVKYDNSVYNNRQYLYSLTINHHDIPNVCYIKQDCVIGSHKLHERFKKTTIIVFIMGATMLNNDIISYILGFIY